MRTTYRLGVVAVSALSCAVGMGLPLAPAQAAERGDGARHSLRGALTDQDFYFVMGDRFANGDTSNDEGGLTGDRNVTGFDPTSKAFYNGGDLKGLASQLEYIEGLGTDAIWLTPIFKNKAVQLEDGPSAGYHGYWITDFTQVDPHLGTNADLADLVEAAHARGIKVFFDIITNHTADVIGYDEGARTAYVTKDASPYRTADGDVFDDRDYAGTNRWPTLDPASSFPYTPVLEPGEEDLKVPAWLNDLTLYHNRGNTTFTGEDSQYGDFFGLDDLFTENPRVLHGMERIYKTWVKDFKIDGFRIDTMKHVDDEFWQSFGPGLVKYAHRQGKKDFFMFGEVALDGSAESSKAFTSHYTTHDKMQAVLDFPFQDAARTFASRSGSNADLVDFFVNDDWYTDRNSNAYSLPTFLGNHDMGRFGYFLKTDNPGADDAELVARDKLAHELMYLSRGNPVVYYGDEQGFTGSGGDQVARQTMFPSLVSDWPDGQDLDNIGSDATPADDNFDTSHPLYQAIARLARLTENRPALRNGAMQTRTGTDGAGIFAFSRTNRHSQREYVVALNNAEESLSASVKTFQRPGTTLTRVYGAGPRTLTVARDGSVEVRVDGLGSAVYRADRRIPASHHAPRITLAKPHAAVASRGRMEVAADVGGHSFYEVTFQAKVGRGHWRPIGTDDNAPYRVFHDTTNLRTGTKVRYRAVVLDNRDHSRASDVRRARVAAPAVTLTAPTDGGTVANIDPVTVLATVDPERATQSVTFQRRVGSDWVNLGTDRSSPAYTVTDDVEDLPLGTEVTYRAILHERGLRVVSDEVTVTTAEPAPAFDSITLAGDLQSELGCPGDWQPDCAATHLGFDTGDGQWHGTFSLPAGTYEWKIAANDGWTQSWGANGGGDNLPLTVPDGGGDFVFSFDQVTHVPSVEPAP